MPITPGLIVYSSMPLDYWGGMMKLDEFLKTETDLPDMLDLIDEVRQVYAEAMEMASHVGWEGDYIDGPYVSFLPNPGANETRPVLAWKQRNNGTTFVASTVPLPHMDAITDSAVHYRGGEIVRRPARRF